jgi:hypothetical protein
MQMIPHTVMRQQQKPSGIWAGLSVVSASSVVLRVLAHILDVRFQI